MKLQTLLGFLVTTFCLNTQATSPQFIAQEDFSFESDFETDFEADDDFEFSDTFNDTENLSTEQPSEYQTFTEDNAPPPSSNDLQQEMQTDIQNMQAPAVERVRPKETPRHRYIKHPNQKHGLYKISADGAYYYKVEESPRSYGVSIKGGAFLFNDLANPRTGASFKEVYGTSAKPTVFVEYLWPFFKDKDVSSLLRAMRIKLGAGFIFASGNGRFSNPIYADVIAPEDYVFLGLPLQVGLQYAFEFYDRQIFVPYGSAALDYMLAMEIQDGEFERSRFLGQLGAHLAGGVAISLGWLEESARFELDREFGINKTYLTVEIRQNIAIQQDFKFTATSVVGGLWLEF